MCGKQFTDKHNVTRHKKIHYGDKNFICNNCEKSFLRKYSLDKHLLIHTGKKPFQCKIAKIFFSKGKIE